MERETGESDLYIRSDAGSIRTQANVRNSLQKQEVYDQQIIVALRANNNVKRECSTFFDIVRSGFQSFALAGNVNLSGLNGEKDSGHGSCGP